MSATWNFPIENMWIVAGKDENIVCFRIKDKVHKLNIPTDATKNEIFQFAQKTHEFFSYLLMEKVQMNDRIDKAAMSFFRNFNPVLVDKIKSEELKQIMRNVYRTGIIPNEVRFKHNGSLVFFNLIGPTGALAFIKLVRAHLKEVQDNELSQTT